MKAKEFGLTIVAALAMLLSARAMQAQDEDGDALLPDARVMARVEASVDRGLEYLLSKQNADGSWPSGFGQAPKNVNNGVNAFCLLAFMGRGHEPGRGPYAAAVDRAVDYLLSTQNQNGVFVSPGPSHGVMYEHALATLALTEAYGSLPSAKMRDGVQRGIDLIVKAQSPLGGWRYQPLPQDADLSVTVMQVVALHAAVNARFEVPQTVFDKALKYVRSCAVPTGGFAYQPNGPPGPARTAAGVLSMQLLGAYDDPAVAKGIQYLAAMKYQPENLTGGHFYYMNYYAMQGAFQAGGAAWANWNPRAREWLLEHQDADGSWPGYSEQSYNGPAACYSTGLATMCLEVYMHYLPAYQR